MPALSTIKLTKYVLTELVFSSTLGRTMFEVDQSSRKRTHHPLRL